MFSPIGFVEEKTAYSVWQSEHVMSGMQNEWYVHERERERERE